MKTKIETDFVIIHFNSANRTRDRETTDATAIHPISQKCEKYLTSYAKRRGIKSANGVLLLEDLGTEVIDELVEVKKFTESTFFVDDIYKAIVGSDAADNDEE